MPASIDCFVTTEALFSTERLFETRTGGSVGWASGCHAGGREFDSGRTITQGLKITEEKVLPLQFHLHMIRLSSLLDKDYKP